MAAFNAKKVEKIGNSILGNKLRDAGFSRERWLTFFRIRDHFADVASVWRGRGAGAFYFAYFVNLLADPRAKTLGSYNVGHRPARNPHSGVVWNLSSESELPGMFEDMTAFVDSDVLPFFREMDLERFVAETRQRGAMFNISEAIALGLCGDLSSVQELCKKDLAFLEKHRDRFDDPDGKAIRDIVLALQEAAVDKARFDTLIEGWRQKKLKELGVEPA